MLKNTEILLLSSLQIDKAKWDECISTSPNGLIYAKSFYLDHLHANWSAFIGENYDWVLPITSRKKWSISYLFQPAFVQQLGIFAKPGVAIPMREIVSALQKHYKFWEINWNYATPHQLLASSIKITSGTNYLLDLSASYDIIAANYHNTLIKNLKISKKNNLTYLCSTDYKNCIDLYQKYYGARIPHLKARDYFNFKSLCKYLLENNGLLCRQVVNKDGQLLSTILLLTDNKRLYNLMNTTSPEGRKMAANHFLIDAVIHEFSGRDLLLDFEGSDLAGVKAFYNSFGGQNQPYYMLKYNKLSWPVKLFKD